MIRKSLFLLTFLVLVLGGGCLPFLEDTTTMSTTLTWSGGGNCNVGVMEPDDDVFWVLDRLSDNGVFTADSFYGGPETWTLNRYHDTGLYTPLVRSIDCYGTITLAITVNDVTAYGHETINAGDMLSFLDYQITRGPDGNTLHYRLVREKAPSEPAAEE